MASLTTNRSGLSTHYLARCSTPYTSEKHIQFKDPIARREISGASRSATAYRVRTRAARARLGGSNTITVKAFPVPERITAVDAKVTEGAIE